MSITPEGFFCAYVQFIPASASAPGNHQSAFCLPHLQLGHFEVCFRSSMANTEREEVILSERPSIIGMWAGDRWPGQEILSLSASVGLIIADGL